MRDLPMYKRGQAILSVLTSSGGSSHSATSNGDCLILIFCLGTFVISEVTGSTVISLSHLKNAGGSSQKCYVRILMQSIRITPLLKTSVQFSEPKWHNDASSSAPQPWLHNGIKWAASNNTGAHVPFPVALVQLVWSVAWALGL